MSVTWELTTAPTTVATPMVVLSVHVKMAMDLNVMEEVAKVCLKNAT